MGRTRFTISNRLLNPPPCEGEWLTEIVLNVLVFDREGFKGLVSYLWVTE